MAGNPDNEASARRALALYTEIADWSLLRVDHKLADLRKFTIRLKGLLGMQATDPAEGIR